MGNAEAVLEAGRAGGTFSAIAALADIGAAADIADACSEAMRRAYWEYRDVQLSVGLAYAGSAILLRCAADEGDDEEERDLRLAVKGLLYNVASFTWPGWDEEGVELAPSDQVAGLAAAHASLDLVEQLELDHLQRSRSLWMLGAHLLTSGSHAEAIHAFDLAKAAAERAGDGADAGLAAAFAALAGVAVGRSGAEDELSEALTELAVVEHGPDFVAQVAAARRVLGI